MRCIPIVQWQKQNKNSSQFFDFHLNADPALEELLKIDLEHLSFSEESFNRLDLKISSDPQGNVEAHTLHVAPNLVEIKSPTVRGLHHGLSTLKMLLASGNCSLPFGSIHASPSFPNRGVMLDVSRGKMPTLEYLKHLIAVLSDLKYNILQLYSEDKLALSKHPSIGQLTGAYTEEQIRELDAFASAHFMELQPSIQTFSHMHSILRLPGYSHLAENDCLFSFAAGNESVYAFLEDVFRETLPWFSSKTLNINLDEAYDLGTGYSKAAVDKYGKGEVLLAHIKRVIDIARHCGAETILIWGDFALRYPEIIPRLPKNTVVLDWNYNPLPQFPTLEAFVKADVPFWAAGGLSTWNSIFPRIYNAYANLVGLSYEARKSGASGFLVTDWGDHGHPQPLELSLYGYIIGAQQSFYPERVDPTHVEDEVWPLIFGDERVQQAFRLLMDSNLAPNIQSDFKTLSFYYLFDDLLDGLCMRGGPNCPMLDRESFRFLLDKGSTAYDLLKEAIDDRATELFSFPDENWAALFGPSHVHALALSARMTRFVGIKGLLAFHIKDTLGQSCVGTDDILALIIEIKELYHEFLAIRHDFEANWLTNSYSTGLQGFLSVYDRAGAQLAEPVKWLATQLRAIRCGEAPDSELTTYRAGKDYDILWTADFKNMWDRAYPWQ